MRREEGSARRGTLLDLVLLFLLILSVVLILFRWQNQKENPVEMSPFLITVRVAEVQPQVAHCLRVGEKVYDAFGEVVGDITRITLSDAKVTLKDGDGYASVTPPDYGLVTLEVEIQSFGALDGGVFLRSGKRTMLIGEEAVLYTHKTGLRYLVVGIVLQPNYLS